MRTRNLVPLLLLAPALVLGTTARAADENTTTVKLSDPSKPGTVRINVGRGELRIQGSDSDEVSVRSDVKATTSKPRKDGLRELATASTFSLTEKNNVVSLESSMHDWGKGGSEYQITVPRQATVIVQNSWGGDIACSGISGDIEVNCMQGEIRLDDVSGGVVAGTMHGEIRANIRELREGKPLSFTSMNGEVHLRLPADAKANVRLRTQNGSVLTDFEESVLVTKAETAMGPVRARGGFGPKESRVLTSEIQEAIREATALSATAVREALEAVKQGLEEAKLNSEEARREVDEARRQIDRARRETERSRAETERQRHAVARAGHSSSDTPPAPPAPARTPLPPKVPMPTISGGKLVTGTLNGGGPEISVATMNGDVILRKSTTP